MESYTETLYDSNPLLRVWVAKDDIFQSLNVQVKVQEDGLALTGDYKNVNKCLFHISKLFKEFDCKMVQYESLAKQLSQLNRGELVVVDDSSKERFKQAGLTPRGIYLYVYDKLVLQNLLSTQTFRRLVNRVALTAEDLVKVLLLNIVGKSSKMFRCSVLLDRYGVFLQGDVGEIERCQEYIQRKLNQYSVHYLMSQVKSTFDVDTATEVRSELKTKGFCCLYNQKIEMLHGKYPNLKSYRDKISRSHGNFLAVLCRAGEVLTINQLTHSVISLRKLETPSVSTNQSLHEPEDCKGKTRRISCQISRIVFKAFKKLPGLSEHLRSIETLYSTSIQVRSFKSDLEDSTYKITFPSGKSTMCIQNSIDLFLGTLQQKDIGAKIHSYVNHSEMISWIHNLVEKDSNFDQVVVDNVRIDNREIKMSLLVARECVYRMVRTQLSKALSRILGYEVTFHQQTNYRK